MGGEKSAALTVIAVEALKATDKPFEVSDGHTAGLRVVVHPTGRKTWILRYRVQNDRTPRKLTIGAFPGVTLKDARGRAAKAIATIADGGDPAGQKRDARAQAKVAAEDTVDLLVDRFALRYLKPKKLRTAVEVERLLRKEVVGVWGGRPISSVGKRDVHRLLDAVVDRGSPIAANRVLAAMRRMFAWAVERGDLAVSPCMGVKPPSAEASRDRVLDDDELAAVWRSCDAIGDLFGPLFRLLLLTGQRREEVGAMRWSEIDLARRLWTLPAERVKTGVKHEVPLCRAAVAILERMQEIPQLDGPGLVFTVTGITAVAGYSKAKTRLNAAIAAQLGAELPSWRLHDLRRSFASGCARIGVQLPVVERALNHTSGSFRGVVAVYQRHQFLDERRAAMDAWGRHIEGIVSAKNDNVVELAAVRA